MKHLTLALALLIAGCAAGLRPDSATADCRALYAELDRKTATAGVRDAASAPVQGYPYLRVNRLLASYRTSVGDDARFNAWLARLKDLDLGWRKVELRNLESSGGVANSDLASRLATCSDQLAAHELADPAARRQVRARAVVPPEYSTARRFFGAYALTSPLLKSGVEQYQRQVRQSYAASLPAAALTLWKPPVAGRAPVLTQVPRDILGVPQLKEEQWARLTAAYAPTWLIETSGAFDRPGVLALDHSQHAQHDAARPAVYFLHSYTRFGGEVLPQLVYIIWFSERPPAHARDAYAGALDGVIWRVTLDRDGKPLVYDSIHACGCYHLLFPAQSLTARADIEGEPPLLPQASLPAGALAVRLQSGSHAVQRVIAPSRDLLRGARTYALLPYRELLSLAVPGDGRRSVFAASGLVKGSERRERFWLWPSGIRSPGAMREYGTHATAFVGNRHFDDADLFDQLFQRR